MESIDLGSALREATREVAPRPGFTEAVVRGSIRRRIRRRMVLGGTALTMAAVLAASAVAIWPVADTVGTTSRRAVPNPMLSAPTRGNLAGDTAYRDKALEAFRAGIANSPNRDRGVPTDLVGEARVYWAGTTPAGRAAVVIQGGPMILDNVSYPEGVSPPAGWNVQPVLIGLVAGDVPTLIDEVPFVKGGPPAGEVFQFGPDDRVVLAFPRDAPLFAAGLTVMENGMTHREWRPLTEADGVAITELPPGTAGADVRVVRAADPAHATAADVLLALPASFYRQGFDRQSKQIADHRLPWPPNTLIRVNGVQTPVPSNVEYYEDILAGAGMLDPFGRASLTGFRIVAGLEGGRSVIAFEYQLGNGPSRLYTLILSADAHLERVHHVGPLDPTAVLPVRVRLPDGFGWLVADNGAALRYRTADTAAWQGAWPGGTLLPDNTTQVEVTRPGAAPVPVDLQAP